MRGCRAGRGMQATGGGSAQGGGRETARPSWRCHTRPNVHSSHPASSRQPAAAAGAAPGRPTLARPTPCARVPPGLPGDAGGRRTAATSQRRRDSRWQLAAARAPLAAARAQPLARRPPTPRPAPASARPRRSKRKGMSAEEKRQTILGIFHESRSVFVLKARPGGAADGGGSRVLGRRCRRSLPSLSAPPPAAPLLAPAPAGDREAGRQAGRGAADDQGRAAGAAGAQAVGRRLGARRHAAPSPTRPPALAPARLCSRWWTTTW